MKKIWILLLVAVLLPCLLLLTGCPEVEQPGIPDQTEIGVGDEYPDAPGVVTKVKSKWSGGDLDFTQKDGTVIMGLDGTNGDVEIAYATITDGLAAALGITAADLGAVSYDSLAPSADGTIDICASNFQANDIYINGQLVTENGTAQITLPDADGELVTDNGTYTFSGVYTINDLVTDNVTVTGGSLSGITIAAPIETGTPVRANVATGNTTMEASGAPSVVITHGLGGTPVCIGAWWGSDPGADDGIFTSSANSTCFTVSTTTANVTPSTVVYWIAYLHNE